MPQSEVQRGRRTGILDVAARAGVSRQTVTRAMNDMPGISAETKQRVLQAARDLQYRPSRFGRGLVTRGTPTLGLVVVDLMNPFWAELASCVLDEAYEQGWTVLIAESSHDARAAISKLLEHVDAVFGLLELPESELTETFGAIPLIHFEGAAGSDGRAGIRLDFASAMDDAVAHLVDNGRRRIAMLDSAHTGQMSIRATRFAEAASRLDLEPLVLHDIVGREPVMENGRLAADEALRRWPDLDAFVCFNDAVAVGAMKHVQEAGLDVPRDVSLVGIDGSAIGRIVTPELTTLRIDLSEVARLALETAIRIVKGDVPVHDADVQWVVRPELVVRSSS